MSCCNKTPAYVIRRGDQCSIPFQAYLGQCVLTPEYVDEVELVLGPLTKLFTKDELKFDVNAYTFLFPLTQRETFSLRPFDCYPTQMRIKMHAFNEGDQSVVYSYTGPDVKVVDSLSNNILK